MSMIFNKITGFYGLLAILTGFSLSPLQLSMYLYSLVALILLAFLMPHIRKQSPFECLALAWFYLLDTLVNTAFTLAFAVTWLLAVSANDSNTAIPSNAPGAGTIDDAAGFTSPKFNVSKVEVIATPVAVGQEAVAFATARSTSSKRSRYAKSKSWTRRRSRRNHTEYASCGWVDSDSDLLHPRSDGICKTSSATTHLLDFCGETSHSH